MMLKRITKPSFKLKSAHTIEFSPCGSYLAHVQSYAKIYVWDIKLRKVINQCKVIKNDSYLGFSDDSQIMFSKNANGELVFFETLTGNVISQTGGFKLNRSGGEASMLKGSGQLFDGDSNGKIILWDIESASEYSKYSFPNHMVHGVKKSPKSNKYFVLVSPKDSLMNLGNKGCKLLTFNEPIALSNPFYLKPNEKGLRRNRHWKRIVQFSVDTIAEYICICIEKEHLEDQQNVVCYNLINNQTQSIKLDLSNEYISSLASNGKHILAVVHTNLYVTGMSPQEYVETNAKIPTEHIHIFELESLKRVAKVEWEALGQIKFHPNGIGLGIAADKKSVYLDDYTVLLGQ